MQFMGNETVVRYGYLIVTPLIRITRTKVEKGNYLGLLFARDGSPNKDDVYFG